MACVDVLRDWIKNGQENDCQECKKNGRCPNVAYVPSKYCSPDQVEAFVKKDLHHIASARKWPSAEIVESFEHGGFSFVLICRIDLSAAA